VSSIVSKLRGFGRGHRLIPLVIDRLGETEYGGLKLKRHPEDYFKTTDFVGCEGNEKLWRTPSKEVGPNRSCSPQISRTRFRCPTAWRNRRGARRGDLKKNKLASSATTRDGFMA
jgi:hypothetical protein